MNENPISAWNRRGFLEASLAGLSAALFVGHGAGASALGAEEPKPTAAPVEGPDTLFLTWQDDPCTSVAIQWVGPEGAWGKEIEVALYDKDPWRTIPVRTKDYPNTDAKVFRCEVTGLTPDTEYRFRIGSDGAVLRFRTMPAKATNTIQFVSGGDCGIGEHAINTNRIAAVQEPRFALIGGDLAYDNGTSPKTFTQFLRNYRAHMVDAVGRLIPMVSCIGNHEVTGAYGKPRSASPQYLSLFDGLFRDTTFGVLDIGDYLSLLLLDTGHIAAIDGEQTSWLERTLAVRQDRPHLIVANHVPAYPSFRPAEVGEKQAGTGALQRQHWSPLFERYRVDAVLEHHDHMFKRTHPLTGGLLDKNGVLYLGDGSWGKLRSPKGPEKRSYLAAVNSTYHMTVHRFEGEDRFHVALEETGKLADVCHTHGKRPSR